MKSVVLIAFHLSSEFSLQKIDKIIIVLPITEREYHAVTYLNLFDVDLLELFLHLLGASFHGIDCVLGVFEALGGEVGLFHIERLIPKVVDLVLILFLLLQNPQGLLLHSVFARPVPHL